MKKPLLIILILMLTGCATWKDSHGNPVSQADDYKCKQQCGFYDHHFNPFMGAACLSDCLQASGYHQEIVQSKENQEAIKESARQSEEFDRLGKEAYREKYGIK